MRYNLNLCLFTDSNNFENGSEIADLMIFARIETY